MLAERLSAVEDRIAAACARAGRSRGDVTLVGVTKYVSDRVATLLAEVGVSDLGENRPQALWRKAEALPTSVRWHLIGHLQRNKVDRTLPLVTLVHSVDSARLLAAIERAAASMGKAADVLVEVNINGDPAKTGASVADVHSLRDIVGSLDHVRMVGLMTMAPLQDAERCRPTFAGLRQLRDDLATRWGAAGEHLRELSMGMSNDFEVAIEEGATLVRIGSSLFEGIPPEVLTA
jgi:pyridoxal phosphate enzyme (YggS family)